MPKRKDNILLTEDIKGILSIRYFSGSYVIVKNRLPGTTKEIYMLLAAYSSEASIHNILSQYEPELKTITGGKWTAVASGLMRIQKYTPDVKHAITFFTIDMLTGDKKESVLEKTLEGCTYSL